jgi:CheY-like chemotaxis protein/predicted regulator of Ras-like GTPase activity (Roadblock/LC7/MglB family)
MYSILFVDDDKPLLEAVNRYLAAYADEFRLSAAHNGREAVRILETMPVDLVVTELRMPQMSGAELFVHIQKHFPAIPIIFMSGLITAEIKNKFQSRNGSPVFLTKPLNFNDLKAAIFAKVQASDKGSINGVSLTSVMQYISLEAKTCVMTARVPGKKPGNIYFNNGEPWDALWENLRGKEAAVEIISWEKAEISFKRLPPNGVKRTIKKELISLIVEAVKFRETKIAQEKPDETGKGETAQPSPVLETSAAGAADIPDEAALHGTPPDDERENPDVSGSAGSAPSEQDEEASDVSPSPVAAAETLSGFLSIPGVEAVLLVGEDGAVVRSSTQACGIDMSKAGASSAQVWGGLAKMGGDLGICGFHSLMLESDDAVIVGAPVKDNLLVVLARDAQRLGMIRLRIKKKKPALEEEVETQPGEAALSS